jgi:hypothetical protein
LTVSGEIRDIIYVSSFRASVYQTTHKNATTKLPNQCSNLLLTSTVIAGDMSQWRGAEQMKSHGGTQAKQK